MRAIEKIQVDHGIRRRLVQAPLQGCYGRLLSLYEIKAGIGSDDDKAEALAKALLSFVELENQRNAERLFRTSEERAKHLSPEVVRFIASAEYLAGHLQDAPQLEWSGAIVVLCKAIEAEIVSRILRGRYRPRRRGTI